MLALSFYHRNNEIKPVSVKTYDLDRRIPLDLLPVYLTNQIAIFQSHLQLRKMASLVADYGSDDDSNSSSGTEAPQHEVSV